MVESYDDILDRSFDELQDDKILPSGLWVLRLRNAHFMAPRDDGQSAQILFFYIPVEPTDDVDADELAALGDDYDWTENQIVYKVWIEGGRSWKELQRHLTKHSGVDWDVGSIREVIKTGVKGSEVVARLGERSFENNFGELVLENVASDFKTMD